MGFGKWLKGATRIRFDDRTLGNLLKNGAVGAGTLVGGPLGLGIAAAGSAAGQKALGGSWKDAAGAGLKGASAAGGINAARGLLSGIGGSTASAAPGAGGGVAQAGSAAADVVPTTGLPLPSVPNLTTIAEQAVDPRNFATKALDAGKGVLNFAEEHPYAAAGALKGVGSIMTSGASNRAANAEADLLEKRAEETEYDFMRRKQRDQQLAPVWSALGSSVGNNYAGVAANPYLPAGG
jgi:hypothetical protein